MNTKPADLYQLTRMYYILYVIKYPELIVVHNRKKYMKTFKHAFYIYKIN